MLVVTTDAPIGLEDIKFLNARSNNFAFETQHSYDKAECWTVYRFLITLNPEKGLNSPNAS